MKKLAIPLIILVSIVIMDLIVGTFKFLPEVDDRFPKYPADSSEYLPFTLPANLDLTMQREEFKVTYYTDNQGYRSDKEDKISNDLDKILVIGDSYTLGWGVSYENSFVGLMQEKLKNNFKILNAAYRGGYSPDSYYAFIKKEGLALDPKLVVVAIYAGNDVIDVMDNIWIKKDENNSPIEIRTYRDYVGYDGNFTKKHYGDPNSLWWKSNIYKLFMAAYDRIYYQQGIQKRSLDQAWKDFSDVIGSTKKVLDQNNIKSLFVVIPYPFHGPSSERHENYDRIMKVLNDQQIKNIVGLKSFMSKKDFYPLDGHFNNEGHEIAYKKIMEYIKNNKLIKTK